MAELHIDIVDTTHQVWSGAASFVCTRTTEGEIGILPRHIPLLAELADEAPLRITPVQGQDLHWIVKGGFMAVTEQSVQIVAESVTPTDH